MDSIPLIPPSGLSLDNLPENEEYSATYSDGGYTRFSSADPTDIPRSIPVRNSGRLVLLFQPQILPLFCIIFALQSQTDNVSEYHTFHDDYAGYIPLSIVVGIPHISGMGESSGKLSKIQNLQGIIQRFS